MTVYIGVWDAKVWFFGYLMLTSKSTAVTNNETFLTSYQLFVILFLLLPQASELTCCHTCLHGPKQKYRIPCMGNIS